MSTGKEKLSKGKFFHSIKSVADTNSRRWKLHEESKELNNILIQEKIDGSALIFGMINNEFRAFTKINEIGRNEEILQKLSLKSLWNKEGKFREVVKEMFPKEETILFIGEILGTGKTLMNKKVKKKSDLQDIFVGFDLWTGKGNKTIEKRIEEKDFNYCKWDVVVEFAKLMELKTTPTKLVQLNIKDERNLFDKYQEKANGGMSLFDPDSNIEGYVMKIEGTDNAVKIVGKDYKEVSKKLSSQHDSATIEDKIFNTMVNEASIEKFIQRLRLNKVVGLEIEKSDFGKISKFTFNLVDDWIDENLYVIKEILEERKKDQTIGFYVLTKFIENEEFVKDLIYGSLSKKINNEVMKYLSNQLRNKKG